MFDSQYLYLWVMFFSLIGPLLASTYKISYYKSWGALFPAIILVGIPFIVWDIIFTKNGFWGFNPKYLSGFYFYGLPLGEIFFFIVIPFCCVFVYRVCNFYFKKDYLKNYQKSISNFLMGFCATVAIVYHDRWYTVLTFSVLTLLIYLHARVWKSKWLSRFYLAYLFILIPFFVVNGILTGFGIEQEIVWYNPEEHIGIRIFTIPFEDAFYGMILILGIIGIYEYLAEKWHIPFIEKSRNFD